MFVFLFLTSVSVTISRSIHVAEDLTVVVAAMKILIFIPELPWFPFLFSCELAIMVVLIHIHNHARVVLSGGPCLPQGLLAGSQMSRSSWQLHLTLVLTSANTRLLLAWPRKSTSLTFTLFYPPRTLPSFAWRDRNNPSLALGLWSHKLQTWSLLCCWFWFLPLGRLFRCCCCFSCLCGILW